ncbi:MAG: glycosyltransferase, partial [Spirochaetota bacterium]
GCVARLHSDKGVEDLVRAAAALELSRINFRIILAGDGPERSRLEQLAERLGVRSRLLFLGFRNDIDSLLQTFDLFVLPSREEGLPMSVLEAMSFGIPVVATRVGGVPEIVLHNQTGILVPDHSPRELARAISTLIQNPVLARKLGEAGRLRVQNHFSFRKTVEQIERLYEG